MRTIRRPPGQPVSDPNRNAECGDKPQAPGGRVSAEPASSAITQPIRQNPPGNYPSFASDPSVMVGGGKPGATTAQHPRALAKALERPRLERSPVETTPLQWPSMDATRITKIAADALRGQMSLYPFSSFNVLEAFLHLRLEHPDLDVLDTTLHTVDSRQQLPANIGGNCVRLGFDLVERLKKTAVHGVLAPMSNEAGPSHGSVLVPFEDSHGRAVVLMEPGFNIGQPLLLRPGQPVEARSWTSMGERSWRFTLEQEGILFEPFRGPNWEHPAPKSIIALAAWTNPDQSFLRGRALIARTAALHARNADGEVTAGLILYLEENPKIGVNAWDLHLFRRPVGGLHSDESHSLRTKEALAKRIDDKFARQFGVEAEQLTDRIWNVYAQRGLIDAAKSSCNQRPFSAFQSG